MPISLQVPEVTELTPRIIVFGVGGAGGNAVNNMIRASLKGAEFVVANTDAQALALSEAEKCIQMGRNITQGLGAGAKPEIGRAAAEESIQEIKDYLAGSNMCFIAAGMGGGTGTGGAPVVARAAKEEGILTVGVVTKPFQFEGGHRMQMAEAGVEELEQYVDTLIIIPNQNLFRIANEKTTFSEAFTMADEVLHSGVRGVTDLMVMPGLINLDFADVRSVMSEMGKAMMGTGEANGEERALAAAEAAISNPLLDDVSMKGARGVLVNITGGNDLRLFEVDGAANRIREEVDPKANIVVGATFDDSLDGLMRVSVVATGIDQIAGAVKLSGMVAGKTAATGASAVPVAALSTTEVAKPDAAEAARAKPIDTIPDTAAPMVVATPAAEEKKPAVAKAESSPDRFEERAIREDNFVAFVAEAPKKETEETVQAFKFPRPEACTAKPVDESHYRDVDADAAESQGGIMRRGLSLIERMKGGPAKTGAGIIGHEAPSFSDDETVITEPAAPVTEHNSALAMQDLLESIKEECKSETAQSKDDQLEIPAFLRRQAN